MRFFKGFLLALLTTFLCIYLSFFFDLSHNLALGFVKSKIRLFSNSGSKVVVNRILGSKGSNLLEESQVLYESGRYLEAVEFLKTAILEFKANNHKLNQAIALSNLSLGYQQLGQWQQATEAITQSIQLLQTLGNSGSSLERSQVVAQAMEVRGKLELAQGQIETALQTWQEAAKIYQHLDDTSALIKNRINQAQAMQALGNYLQARNTLNSVQEVLQKQANSSLKARGLTSLGNVLQSLGYLNDSQKILEESLLVAREVDDINAQSNALLSLGNISRAQRYTEISLGNSKNAEVYAKRAIEFYQQATQIASTTPITSTIALQAQLNQLRLLVEQNQFSTAKALLPQIQSQINLPASRTSVNMRINFAESLSKMIEYDIPREDVARMLAQAVEMANNLQDQRSESYALGTMGELYEQTGQLSDAKDITQHALRKAESINAQDIAYQWYWQLGRILQKQSDIPAATVAYNRAYNALKSLRNDLVAINPDVQFSFRESVEPVYRQYVDLLLKSAENHVKQQNNLVQAREVIESLQLAELNNFFRSPCVQPKVGVDELVEKQKSTAVIYPIILDDRLEIITRLPGQDTIYRQTTKISQDVLEKTVEQLQQDLPVASREPDVQQYSQQLYDWLIQPIESYLTSKDIETLVFVLDGSLRNIPMGILYDKQQQKYLIEKYAIALTPGLQLVDPKPLKNVPLNALVAGIEAEQVIEGKSFSSLPNVGQELKQVQAGVKKSEELLNQDFTKKSLQNKIQSNPFSVVHLATHGQFSSDPEQTYISVWQDLLKVKELDSLLRVRVQNRPETIELLVLSACKTATGDKRAALGLAGVAVQGGARSTIATLWTVDDESTSNFMGELYRQLDGGVTKAAALQKAQLAILAQEHRPYFWAPYVLVGNWL
ncbi:CHAT domain-containing protein [Plectonema cf. radiosum LEGE 06105]|uniref:CHAT domain-containing protein n=1 Tax=Plectonema cf. radiosum LEGE 06105 TaxID=945769 RepID=A0A8J7F3A3_9CYAN|nr:CHAT domain-containing protein [Plectonema radiosum]MBE9214202.1 CHAT domain-containing protein [Plectonema cf. radiosum LEGE 06105]